MVSLTIILVVSCAMAVFSLLPRPNTSSLKSLDSPPTSRTRDTLLAPACQIGADLRPPVPFQIYRSSMSPGGWGHRDAFNLIRHTRVSHLDKWILKESPRLHRRFCLLTALHNALPARPLHLDHAGRELASGRTHCQLHSPCAEDAFTVCSQCIHGRK